VLAPGFVHAIHPGHGEPVVFTPGELLPPWVDEALAAGAELVAGEGGLLTLALPGRRAKGDLGAAHRGERARQLVGRKDKT
jgi:hypothetical protein